MNTLSKSSPESPAKEQPGEVAAMVKRLRARASEEGELSGYGRDERLIALLYSAAALIEKLGQGWIPASNSVEPTEKMLDAAIVEHDSQRVFITLKERYAGIWRAMESARRSECQKDCPYAAPFRYCETCAVSPCPIGLERMPPPPERP